MASGAPRLSCDVGRTKKTKKTDHINHHEIASGCCGRRGCLLQGGVGFRNNERSRPAAPLSGGPSIRAGKSRHVPSARATSSIGRQGTLIPMTPARRSGLRRTAARPWRAVGTGRAPSVGRVVQAPAPSLVHPGRVVRIIRPVSQRRATSPNLVAAVGDVPAPQLG